MSGSAFPSSSQSFFLDDLPRQLFGRAHGPLAFLSLGIALRAHVKAIARAQASSLTFSLSALRRV